MKCPTLLSLKNSKQSKISFAASVVSALNVKASTRTAKAKFSLCVTADCSRPRLFADNSIIFGIFNRKTAVVSTRMRLYVFIIYTNDVCFSIITHSCCYIKLMGECKLAENNVFRRSCISWLLTYLLVLVSNE